VPYTFTVRKGLQMRRGRNGSQTSRCSWSPPREPLPVMSAGHPSGISAGFFLSSTCRNKRSSLRQRLPFLWLAPTRSPLGSSSPNGRHLYECGPTVVQYLCFRVFPMTLGRSRRRQVVEMKCCRLFCWPHNPKVGGSNPPPATNELIRLRAIGHSMKQLGRCLSVPFAGTSN